MRGKEGRDGEGRGEQWLGPGWGCGREGQGKREVEGKGLGRVGMGNESRMEGVGRERWEGWEWGGGGSREGVGGWGE